MEGKPFYMIAEDCFERKEFLGCISHVELDYLANIFSEKEDFSLTEFSQNLEMNLKAGELYLKEIKVDEDIIQKYQNLTSYTGGVELFLIACALKEREKMPGLKIEEDKKHQSLLNECRALFQASFEQYQRSYASGVTHS